jgi:cell division control protein 45
MDLSLRQTLHEQLDSLAPEVGLIELTYPSFDKPFPKLGLPRIAAADVVAGVQALLEAATGVRISVETQGAQGGGELFGGAKLWDLKVGGGRPTRGKENLLTNSRTNDITASKADATDRTDEPPDDDDDDLAQGEKAWVQNFWIAYDALGNEYVISVMFPVRYSDYDFYVAEVLSTFLDRFLSPSRCNVPFCGNVLPFSPKKRSERIAGFD